MTAEISAASKANCVRTSEYLDAFGTARNERDDDTTCRGRRRPGSGWLHASGRIPDSHLGTWEPALAHSHLSPIRATREGEAIGLAAGLMLGGARPLVAMQCTGFFEAGDALQNVVYDLSLPLKMIVGVRSWHAERLGKSADNCPRFSEALVRAWDLSHELFDCCTATEERLAQVLETLVARPGAGAILWAE